MSKQSITIKENTIKKVDIIQKGNEMIIKVPFRITAAKLEVLNEVAKSEGIELVDLLENSVDEMIRSTLESDDDIGKAIHKRLLNTWQKEIGKDLTYK